MGINNRGGALFWATGIDNSGLKKGKEQAAGIIKGLMKQVSGFDVFAGIGVSAAMAFAKITKEAYAFSKEFQTAMKEVQTISRATQENYEGMSDAIVKMSREVPDSAVELTKAFYEIVSAGYDGARGLELLEAASRGAVAGVTTTTVAADGLTTILNAWKLETSEVTKVNDIMFRTVELGKVTYDELAGSIAQVAPLAAASGVSFEEVGAAIATLTKQGTPAAQAITQIRSAMIAMNEQLGTGWGEALTLQEGFQALADISKETGKQLNEVTGRVEGAMAVLATTGKNAQGAADDIKSIGEAAGSTEKAYSIMVESADVQMKILANNLKERLKDYGDYLVVSMADIVERMNRQMLASAEKRDKAKIASAKRDQTIIESELSTLDNPIDTFFRGKQKTEERRKELQAELDVLKGFLKSAQIEADKLTAPAEGGSAPPPMFDQKNLDEAKKGYEEYQMLVINGFKKEADLFYQEQLKAGATYKEYLIDQLRIFENDVDARKELYLELSALIQKETEAQKKAEEEAFIPLTRRLEALKKMSESINKGSASNNFVSSSDNEKTTGSKAADAISKQMMGKIGVALSFVTEVQTKSERVSRTWDNIITDITNPEAWSTAAAGVREIGYLIGQSNQEMGEMMMGVGDVMDGMVSALAKGATPLAMIQGGMQAFAGLARIFESAGAYAKTFDDILEDMNRNLEKQQRLLDLSYRKGDTDKAFQGNLDALNDQKKALEENIRLQELAVAMGEKLGFFGRLSAGISLSKLNEELQKYKDQLNDVNIQIEDLGQSWTDFNAGLVTELDLAEQIAQGFADGKTSAADFASYVNDIMKDAVLEVFKASILGPQLTKAQEFLSAAFNDQELTGSEIEAFQRMMNGVIRDSEAVWNSLTGNLDMNAGKEEDAKSLSGSIRASLTEETGSILAGTMNAMRMDLRELVVIQLDSIRTLSMIEDNTRKLYGIDQSLISIKDSFQNIGK